MEKALKSAREERDIAMKGRYEAEELAAKNKLKFEQHKEEWNKNLREENIKVKEVDFDKYRSTGGAQQSKGAGGTNHQSSSARPM